MEQFDTVATDRANYWSLAQHAWMEAASFILA